MKTISSLSNIFLCIFFILLPFACSKPIEADLIVSNVNVINVENGEILNSQDVVIIGDSIAQITHHKRVNDYTTVNIIDATDKYLIPGLWDMHTHTWWGYEDFYPLLLSNGITGVREMFGNMDVVNEIKRLTQSDSLISPDYISAGPIICGDPPSLRSCVVAKTPKEGREYVRQQKADGADFIKTYNMLKRDVYMAIADECKKQNIVMTGHIPFDVSLPTALKQNHKSIEHFYGILEYCCDTVGLAKIDKERKGRFNYSEYIKRAKHVFETYNESRENEVIELLENSNTWVCPTYTVHLGYIRTYDYDLDDQRRYYLPDYALWSSTDSVLSKTDSINLKVEQDYYNLMLKLSRKLRDRKIRFLAGSDYCNPFTYPGFSLHEELQIFVEEVGFSPLEALRSATINPAIYFNLEGELGTVEQGKRASLLLLNRNPLNDIKHTQEIEGVILRGKYMMGDSLRTAIEKIAEENRRPKLESALKPLITEKGIKAAISEYHRLTKERPTSYNFNREQLNSLGHSLLGENKVDEAIQIFLLNVEVYPDYGNGWDSLGEGYLAQGDTTKAVGAWETAIRKRNYSTKKRLNDLLLDYKTD